MRISREQRELLAEWMRLPHEVFGRVSVLNGWAYFLRSHRPELQPSQRVITFHTHPPGMNTYEPPSRDDIALVCRRAPCVHWVVTPKRLYVLETTRVGLDPHRLIDDIKQLQNQLHPGTVYNQRFLDTVNRSGLLTVKRIVL
jgi:hypothetical protein